MPTLSVVLGFGVAMRRVPLRLYASALDLRSCIFFIYYGARFCIVVAVASAGRACGTLLCYL